MRIFIYSGNTFFLLALIFILISVFATSSASFILAVFWFIFGLAVRNKFAQPPTVS